MNRKNGETGQKKTSFKDLWIWQESHDLMLRIHEFSKTLPADERYRKRDQIERSSSSVPDNISEGYAAYYFNDKIKGMYVARKEAAETQNHLEALVGKKYLDRVKADRWFDSYERIIAGINSYINFIRDKTGTKKGEGKKSRIT